MLRGMDRSAIFADQEDRRTFLRRLGENLLEGGCAVYAWVLMNNHAHLLFKSGRLGISGIMRRLLTGYAQYYNRRHSRTGHLFENRYKSILCEEDAYLLALVRYIHLNPIRAKVVATLIELDRYPWSGHRAIMGKAQFPWMDTEYVLVNQGESGDIIPILSLPLSADSHSIPAWPVSHASLFRATPTMQPSGASARCRCFTELRSA